ncbi:thiazole synthase [Streptomyces cyaneofuscatus]|uniref:thiazole synthase n=1 Tax=Streptomyces cyaneofuscatus TaxID=66883 RepID=UPI002952F6BD|nr:thiazole synthase [Streptomyces cyaneofuscatus]WOP09859.1 thiazole synthase [Streptomyces cyaneofuscatus]
MEQNQPRGTWQLGSTELTSRLMLAIPEDAPLEHLGAILEAGAIQSATIKVSTDVGAAASDTHEVLQEHGVHVLPNTVDAADADDAVRAAHHGAALVDRPWVKLIITQDPEYNVPNPAHLLQAAERLVSDGFEVFPLIPDDPGLAVELARIGCAGLMPQGSPAGSGQGIANPLKFRLILDRVDVPVLAGAGIGTAADACQALEMGCAGVASAKVIFSADDQETAARALADAVSAGHLAWQAAQPRS